MGRGPEEHKAEGIQIAFGKNVCVGLLRDKSISVNLASVFNFQAF